jgi:hypothetical protein
MCDGCWNRPEGLYKKRRHLCRFQGYYKDTEISVSMLYKTDLQNFYWKEPMCNVCCYEWTKRHQKELEELLVEAVVKIQKWYWGVKCIIVRIVE